MILSKEQIKEFKKASKPLIEYLNEYLDPYTTIIIKANSIEILSTSARIINKGFIKG